MYGACKWFVRGLGTLLGKSAPSIPEGENTLSIYKTIILYKINCTYKLDVYLYLPCQVLRIKYNLFTDRYIASNIAPSVENLFYEKELV